MPSLTTAQSLGTLLKFARDILRKDEGLNGDLDRLPSLAVSDLVREIKTGATHHINESRWVAGRFAWQEGFGAFSYSHSRLTDVIHYIQNQEAHHTRKGFQEEYREFLVKFNVAYDERYLLQPVE